MVPLNGEAVFSRKQTVETKGSSIAGYVRLTTEEALCIARKMSGSQLSLTATGYALLLKLIPWDNGAPRQDTASEARS